MKEKINIVIKFFLVIIILSFVFTGLNCYAAGGMTSYETSDGGGGTAGGSTGGSSTTAEGDIINPNLYNPNGHLTDDDNVNVAIGKVIGAVRLIGSVVSVIAIVAIGIRYMMSTVDGKAEYKKTMIQYLIGAILLFMGSNIVSIIYNMSTNMFNT